MWIKRVLFWLEMSFEIVLRLFCIVGWDWFCVVFEKWENVEFSKEMLSKFCKKNSCSCFGYRLSYNHPNEVIPIDKEP